LTAKQTGDADFSPGATASSGLTVSYASSNTAVATIIAGQIHVVGAGTAIITASQSGNTTHAVAARVTRTLVISTPSLTSSKAQ
jgi:trimeric autotransporter adhesin